MEDDSRSNDASSRPHYLTSFVGREHELAELRSLTTAESRLVVLLGPPGVGKTRLAVEFLRSSGQKGDDALFCDLRSASTLEDVGAGLGHVLDVRLDEGGGHLDVVSHLGRALAARGSCIVVLDNVEHLLSAASEALRRWLSVAPDVHFLVTSREALGVDGERLMELKPLPVPPHSEGSQWDPDLPECPSVVLFGDRARSVEPSFQNSGKGLPVVAEIVRRLDGNPLAIELAASQLRHSGPHKLLEKLEGQLLSFRTAYRDSDPRHRSLQAAVETSWRLLKPWEQAAFAQLSVFSGGFDSSALVRVLDLSRFASAPPILEVVASLRRSSMLHVTDVETDPRWDIYATLSQFGSEQLAATPDDRDASSERHAAYFLERGEDWIARIPTADGVHASSRLVKELSNLRSAWQWIHGKRLMLERDGAAVPEGVVRHDLQLAIAVATVLQERLPALATATLSQAIEVPSKSTRPDSDLLVRALLCRARCHRLTGMFESAEADLRRIETLETHRALGPEYQFEVGMLQHFGGTPRIAAESLKRALTEAQNKGAHHLEATISASLGWVLAESQDERAFDHYRRAITLFRSQGDETSEIWARACESHHSVYFQRGQPQDELLWLLQQAKGINSPAVEALVLRALGVAHWDREQPQRAIDFLERALKLSRRTGMRREQALALGILGGALEEAGESLRGLRTYENAGELYRRIGDERNEGLMLLFQSGLVASRGDPDLAASHLDDGRRRVIKSDDRGFVAITELIEARINLARSRRLRDQRMVARADTLYAEALSVLDRNGGSAEAPSQTNVFHKSLAYRFVLRCLTREIESSRPKRTLRIWSDGSAFQFGEELVIELPRGPVIRHLLRTLAEQHASAPGEPLSYDDLLQRVWPGERILPTAAKPRVHTMIWHLRRAGLADAILSSPDGYQLDPRLAIHLVDPT